MSEDLTKAAEAVIKQYPDPYVGQDLISAGVVKSLDIQGEAIRLVLEYGFPMQGVAEQVKEQLIAALVKIEGIRTVEVDIKWKVAARSVQPGVSLLKNIRNIVAVASGKGGVGKSTVTVNLALAMAKEGARVGILDADIYGPSQPRMLGTSQKPETIDGKMLLPVVSHGIQSMSIGYLVEPDTAMIWRGPMVSGALQQLLNDTQWDSLDYLFIDMPPGTGDIHLTLSQKIPVTGSVIVTTPQAIAVDDARKGISMFNKVKVPVLGIVENMSTHICSACHHEENIFGEGGGASLADEMATTLLGQLPLNETIRSQTDAGTPTVAIEPEGVLGKKYREIARKVGGKLSLLNKDYSTKFPKIVIAED